MRPLFLFAALCLVSCGEGKECVFPRPAPVPVVRNPEQEEMLEQQRLAQKEMEEAERKAREIKERLLRSEQQLK